MHPLESAGSVCEPAAGAGGDGLTSQGRLRLPPVARLVVIAIVIMIAVVVV